MALQTRSSKFGKLKNGMLVVVSSMLVGRMRHHFAQIGRVDVIFGRNGWIWVYFASNSEVEVGIEVRQEIVRVASLIKLLGISRKTVSVESVRELLEYTKEIYLE